VYPLALLGGIILGDRVFEFSKKFHIWDFTNKLYCELDFEDHSSIFNKVKKLPKNGFVGQIHRVSDEFLDKLRSYMEKTKDPDIKFNPKNHATESFDEVEGDWLHHCDINGKRYWEYGKDWGH